MSTNNFSIQDWADKVIAHINSSATNAEALVAAIKSVEEEYGTSIPTNNHKLLTWLRGDEPIDSYENMSPVEYANFLTIEWHMFGPEGE